MLSEVGKARPFVTIGVPTYNRYDLLRQTLDSILAQTFGDFEVIIGNDYTAEILTSEMLGLTDPRIRIVNHPRNLREVGNMNSLLGLATGRYFTWLFDDDLYEPNFLQTAHECLAENAFPPAFFSSFRMLQANELFTPRSIPFSRMEVLTGSEFLRRYSPDRPAVVSTCGLFDTALLRDVVGGVEELCASAIGVYCEYLFLVRCALLERMVYVDSQLVLFRIHPESWSENVSEYAKYVEAGGELVRRCAETLRHPRLKADYNVNLMTICEQHLITIANRTAKIEVTSRKYGIIAFYRAIARYRKESRNTKENFVSQGGKIGLHEWLDLIKIDLNCYRNIALILASCFYRSIKG